jgi:hypothetical protein
MRDDESFHSGLGIELAAIRQAIAINALYPFSICFDRDVLPIYVKRPVHPAVASFRYNVFCEIFRRIVMVFHFGLSPCIGNVAAYARLYQLAHKLKR